MSTQTEEYAEAFREIAMRVEVGDIPLPPEGEMPRLFLRLVDQTPGTFACAALALGAEMEIRNREAWASVNFGPLVVTLYAPASEVTYERPVVVPERVFAEPEPRLVAVPVKLAGASEMYRGHHLAPAAGGHCVVRGEAHRIVHRAASFDAARDWVAAQVPAMELGDEAA